MLNDCLRVTSVVKWILYKLFLAISQKQAHFGQFDGTDAIFLQVILMVNIFSLIKSKGSRLFDCLTYLN